MTRRRRRSPATLAQEAAFLELLGTAALLERDHARFLRAHDLTPTQYNVLRILRGSHPDPLPCGEIGQRLVTPVPDVTRLLDRLEAKGLTVRILDPGDRRVVRVEIAAAGLELLARLDGPVDAWLERSMGGLDRAELGRLAGLLADLRHGGRKR